MKKLTLLLAAAVTCFTASAQLYVTGANVEGASAAWVPASALEVQLENGVYTFQATNDFKISTANGTWNQFNAGSKNLSGKWTKATTTATANLKSGSDPNILPPMSDVKITYEVNEALTTIKATLPDGLTFGEEQPKDFYLIGPAFGGWTLKDSKNKMIRSGNVYTYVAENGIVGNWKINDGTWNVQFGSNGSSPVVGEVYYPGTGSNPGEISSNIREKATITFTYNEDSESTILITTEGSVEYPEQIFVVGYVDGKDFLPTSTVALAKGEVDGTYEGEVNCTGALGTEYSYIQLATAAGTSVSDWAGLGTRYGAPEADATITEEPSEIVPGKDMSWKMAVGTYTIKVSLVDLTISAVAAEVPAKKFGLVGTIADQGWNIGAPIEMEETEENVFSYGLESVAEGALFKIATIAEYATDQEAWDNTYGAEAPLGSEDAPNINVVNAGHLNAWLKSSSNFYFAKAMTDVTITFTYNATAGEASTVTVTGTVVDTPAGIDATFNFPEICDAQPTDAWQRDGNTQNTYIDMTEPGFSSNGITMTCEKSASNATGMRLYKSGNYKDLRGYKNSPITIACPKGYYIESIKAYSSSTAGTAALSTVTIDETLVSGAALTTDLPEGMKCGYEWTPVSNSTLRQFITLTPTKTTRFTIINVVAKQSPTSVEGIGEDVDENAPVEYYNLNGVRVAEPENGIFIRRQGSKVTKIIVR